MSSAESYEFFNSDFENGFIAEEDGLIVGVVGFNTYQGFFFVHSCFCCDPRVYIGLHRKLVSTAKAFGFKAFRLAIDHDNSAWLKRARLFPGVKPITTVFQLEF